MNPLLLQRDLKDGPLSCRWFVRVVYWVYRDSESRLFSDPRDSGPMLRGPQSTLESPGVHLVPLAKMVSMGYLLSYRVVGSPWGLVRS